MVCHWDGAAARQDVQLASVPRLPFVTLTPPPARSCLTADCGGQRVKCWPDCVTETGDEKLFTWFQRDGT